MGGRPAGARRRERAVDGRGGGGRAREGRRGPCAEIVDIEDRAGARGSRRPPRGTFPAHAVKQHEAKRLDGGG